MIDFLVKFFEKVLNFVDLDNWDPGKADFDGVMKWWLCIQSVHYTYLIIDYIFTHIITEGIDVLENSAALYSIYEFNSMNWIYDLKPGEEIVAQILKEYKFRNLVDTIEMEELQDKKIRFAKNKEGWYWADIERGLPRKEIIRSYRRATFSIYNKWWKIHDNDIYEV